MDQAKRDIIVKEIEHWQRSKLLPDHYCDFLLNLYRDPGANEATIRQARKRAIIESNPTIWFLIIGFVGLICYVALHFSGFSPLLQISIYIAAVISAHGASIFYRTRKPLLSYVLFGLGAFLLLFGGALMLQSGGEADAGTATFYIACCALIWIVFGLALNVPWIHLVGWIGMHLAYAAAIHRLVAPESWAALQLSWLPVAALFAWVGWLISKRAKQAGAVFLIVACLLWFVPEAYAYGWTEQQVLVIQALMLGKLILLGVFAFTLRKTWTEWVV